MKHPIAKKSLLSLVAFGMLAANPITAVAAANPPSTAPTNPALVYWQAFSQLPIPLPPDEQKIYDNPRTVPVDDKYAALAKRFDPAFRLARRAVAMNGHADWGVDMADGPEALLPHLAKAKAVALAAAFRARYFVAHGKPRDAAQDLVAALVLGRHCASDNILISTLVSIAIDSIVGNSVAELYFGLDAESAGMILAGLDASPPAASIRDCIDKGERSFGAWFRQQFEQIRTREGGDEARSLQGIRELIARTMREEKDYTVADRMLQEVGGTTEGLLNAINALNATYDEMVSLAERPYPESGPAIQAFFERVEASKNPFVHELMPALKSTREKEFRAQARITLLRAGLIRRIQGEDAMRGISDPFGSGPLRYRRVTFQNEDRGFELSSELATQPREVLIFVEKDGPPFRVSGTKPGAAVSKQ